MSRSSSGRTAREAVISARTCANSGTATVVTPATVDGVGLDLFDELVAFLDVTTAFVGGTSPTMDIYLQRAVRPNADPTVDADWEDLYHFTQVVSATLQRLVGLPAVKTVTAEPGATQGHARTLDTLAAESGLPGHWGDKLRVREKIGGTVGTACVYSLYFTGLRKSGAEFG